MLDDLSITDVAILSRASHRASPLTAVFRTYTARTDRCLAIRKLFHTRNAKQEVFTFLLSELEIVFTCHCNFKGKISGGLSKIKYLITAFSSLGS